MSIPKGLRAYLKGHHIKFKTIKHPKTYTAQQLAHNQHVTGDWVLKAVLLWSGNDAILALIPATYKVDFSSMKKTLGSDDLRLGTESEMRKLFSDCEIGAVPPVGEPYQISKVYADKSLRGVKDVLFSGGTHQDAVRASWVALAKSVKPKIARIARHI